MQVEEKKTYINSIKGQFTNKTFEEILPFEDNSFIATVITTKKANSPEEKRIVVVDKTENTVKDTTELVAQNTSPVKVYVQKYGEPVYSNSEQFFLSFLYYWGIVFLELLLGFLYSLLEKTLVFLL